MKNDPATVAAAGGVSRSGWGYLAMVCVYLYGLIYCATWQGITWVYCSEIFPIGELNPKHLCSVAWGLNASCETEAILTLPIRHPYALCGHYNCRSVALVIHHQPYHSVHDYESRLRNLLLLCRTHGLHGNLVSLSFRHSQANVAVQNLWLSWVLTFFSGHSSSSRKPRVQPWKTWRASLALPLRWTSRPWTTRRISVPRRRTWRGRPALRDLLLPSKGRWRAISHDFRLVESNHEYLDQRITTGSSLHGALEIDTERYEDGCTYSLEAKTFFHRKIDSSMRSKAMVSDGNPAYLSTSTDQGAPDEHLPLSIHNYYSLTFGLVHIPSAKACTTPPSPSITPFAQTFLPPSSIFTTHPLAIIVPGVLTGFL